MICLEDENVLTRKRICETLERIFASKSASTVSTHIFGSSINGLGLKGCDLDVYVDVPGNPKSFENGSQNMFVFGFGCFHDAYLKFLFYLDILKHEHGDMESAKANMVAHVLRSTDDTHSIRKVLIWILTMMNSYIRIDLNMI